MEHKLQIQIPEGLVFESLRLSRDSISGDVIFDWAVIEQICAASRLDPNIFKNSHEGNVSGLIIAWYAEHRLRGGAKNPVCEQLIAEVEAEDKFGVVNVQKTGGMQ